jgi:general nucleoside transport system permease protein
MIALEPRASASHFWTYASPVLALAITVVVAIGIFIAFGKDPIRGLGIFFWEPIKSQYALTELVLKATPLIIIALGLALCFRANVWNIGAEGQFLLGAIVGGGVALWATENGVAINRWAFMWITLFAGVIGGMLWAAIAALAKDKFNANEILVTLMLVYVANLLLSYLVFGPWKDPKGFNFPQSMRFADDTLLPRLFASGRAHVGFAISLVLAALMWLFMFRMFRGYQLQVGGIAPLAARYAGFSSRNALWTSLLVSGGLAGMAGAMEVAGPMGQLTPHVSNGYGFTAIIVAFVGRLNPIGAVFAAFLLSMFLIGGELSQSRLGLPSALTGVFQGLLLFALLMCDTLITHRVRWARSLKRAGARA